MPWYVNSFVVLSTISHSVIPLSSGTKPYSFASLKNLASAKTVRHIHHSKQRLRGLLVWKPAMMTTRELSSCLSIVAVRLEIIIVNESNTKLACLPFEQILELVAHPERISTEDEVEFTTIAVER